MASRSNLTGRKDGFGRGPLSKVYGKARKLAQGARDVGAAPGTPLNKIKAAAKERGGLRGMARGARKLAAGLGNPGEVAAPGLDQLTGGGPPVTAPIQAPQAPAAPDITINPMRGGRMRRPRNQPVIDHAAIAPAASLTPPIPGTAQGTPPLAPQPESSNIAINDAPNAPTANQPGGSIRSRGLNRRV